MYEPAKNRYEKMVYRQVGNSGLYLSAFGLGFWHSFGDKDPFNNQKALVQQAFDLGITYFDLANNYGPDPGSAEANFGRIMTQEMAAHRDEMVIATKAGYEMWPGPYGNWGSRKSIIASADQSLARLQLDYVDIFYSHRPDQNTPAAETALALDQLVSSGKALYIGLSNYDSRQTQDMQAIFADLKTPYIVAQPRYNLFNRQPEQRLFPLLKQQNTGAVCFSPLAQGLLTDRYLHGIPNDSRAALDYIPFLEPKQVQATLQTVKALNELAKGRQQTLAQMALAWDLRQDPVASVIIGASQVKQLAANVQALNHLDFTASELDQIEAILAQQAPIDWSHD